MSEATASSSEKTEEAFHFSYKYTRKEFGDWPNHRILAPEPLVSLPASADEESLPLGPSWLGPPADIKFSSRVELPKGYRPDLPAAIHVKHDFAQFDVTYEFKDGKLVSERHLKTLMREVPTSERNEYKEFVKIIQNDYSAFISLSSGSDTSVATGIPTGFMTTFNTLRSLPDSSIPEATRLESEARDAAEKHDAPAAVSSLRRAVSADPKFTRAWVLLGQTLFEQKQTAAGVDAFRKAMASDPAESAIPRVLGWGLMAGKQWEDAVPVWQDYMKAHPEDVDGPANLGNCLGALKRYSEAAAVYETAVKIRGDRPNLQVRLGSAYLDAGDRDKAAAAFSKLAEIDNEGVYFNDVAYRMANDDLKLPLALTYARKAVRNAEEASQKITLSDLKKEDLGQIQVVAAYWDTLGWVEERMSKLEEAELYLRASWRLTQDGVVAGHLCHLYRREHKVQRAIEMCRMGIYRMPITSGISPDQFGSEMAAAKENLDFLTREGAKPGAGDASDMVIHEREFKLPRFLQGTESAEFFVLLTSDGKSSSFKVEDVKFISGSDKMKLQGNKLKSIDFQVPAPSDVLTRFVRRGILGCYQSTGCSFVLLDPASVHSLN